jgi:hypothetical protein
MEENSKKAKKKTIHTYYQIWVEFCGNGQNDLLKSIHVIAISHTLRWPWDVDVPDRKLMGRLTGKVGTRTHTSRLRLRRLHDPNYRLVHQGRIYHLHTHAETRREHWDHYRMLPEYRFLGKRSVSCMSGPGSKQREWRPGKHRSLEIQALTMMDIPVQYLATAH